MSRSALGRWFPVALYLLRLLFAGIGMNMISHILMTLLTDADRKFDSEHK
jgi:hypothetical protein